MNNRLLLAYFFLALVANPLPAGELSVLSSSVGGGGASAGGTFSVRGTIGETTPALPALSGSAFSVSGGFVSRIAVMGATAGPQLTLRRTLAGYEIFWPLPAEGFVLQEARVLAAPGPGNWIDSTAIPTDQSGRRVVNLPLSGPVVFFRLLKRP